MVGLAHQHMDCSIAISYLAMHMSVSAAIRQKQSLSTGQNTKLSEREQKEIVQEKACLSPQGIHGFCSAAAVEGGRLTQRAVFRGVGGEAGGGREE